MSKQILHNRIQYTFDSPMKPILVADRIRAIRESGSRINIDDSNQIEMPFWISHQHKGYSDINITGTITQLNEQRSRLEFQCEIMTSVPNTRLQYFLAASIAVFVALGAYQLGQWFLPNPEGMQNTIIFAIGAFTLGFAVIAIASLSYLSIVRDNVGKVRWYGEQTLGRLVEQLLELKQDEKIIDISRLRTMQLNPDVLDEYKARIARQKSEGSGSA